MNLVRIALATLAAFVAYFAVGGVFFTIRSMRAEFAKYPAVYRSGDMMKSVMAPGMFGILLAIGAAAVLFALIHPAGAGIAAGFHFGIILAVFQLGSFVLHNYMNLNIGGRLAALQGIAYSAEWIMVGVVIGLVYRG